MIEQTRDAGGAEDAVLVEVYRSARHALMYVYLPSGEQAPETFTDEPSADLSVLPAALLERFGRPVYALTFELSAQRKLAVADARSVLAALRQQGFYLQLPPTLRMHETPDAQNPHERR